MLKVALAGALLAGAYGVAHDQVTYWLCPEYFTKLKFEQFAYADLGGDRRLFVATIGFLATWWVGFITGWFLARVMVPHFPTAHVWRRCWSGFARVFVSALAGGATGAGLGERATHREVANWMEYASMLGVTDVGHFIWVAYIHVGSYAGALAGLFWALIYAKRCY
ncbi:MAG: hypothetical protein ACOYMN_02355 [Roseimicrobium sp.]